MVLSPSEFRKTGYRPNGMKKLPFCCVFFLFIGAIAAAEYAELPLITELSPQNYLFQQYSDDVLYARKALAAGKTARELPLQFYRYKAQKEDTAIRIAARCSIPYDALITLNGIESVKTPLSGKMLLLPTLPALYLPEKPVSDIEKLTDALSKKLKTESFSLTLPSFLFHCIGFRCSMQWLPQILVCGKAPLPVSQRIMPVSILLPLPEVPSMHVRQVW